MESDSWTRISSTNSRRNQYRSDAYRGEEYEGEDESRPEFMCPFCTEDFDVVGLWCHIDEQHSMEANNGVCPLCGKKVGSELVRHMTVQHGSILKVQPRRRLRKGASNLSFSNLRKELREGKYQSLFGGSSYLIPSSNSEPDPLLSSFISNSPAFDGLTSNQQISSIHDLSNLETNVKDLADNGILQPVVSEEDQKEKAKKCEFVQGLLISTFLDDNL